MSDLLIVASHRNIESFWRLCTYWCFFYFFACFQRFGEPVEERYREQEERSQTFDELGKRIQLLLKVLELYKQKVNT